MINICCCTRVNHSSTPSILMVTQTGICIVLLVLLAIMLILISSGGSNFVNFGEDKIGVGDRTGDGVSEYGRLCWECCRKDYPAIACSNFPYNQCDCSCKLFH